MSATQHEVLQVDVADALKTSLQEAKAEAQRVRDCQTQLSRQHQVLQAYLTAALLLNLSTAVRACKGL